MEILKFTEALVMSFLIFGSVSVGIVYLFARLILNFDYDRSDNKWFEREGRN